MSITEKTTLASLLAESGDLVIRTIYLGRALQAGAGDETWRLQTNEPPANAPYQKEGHEFACDDRDAAHRAVLISRSLPYGQGAELVELLALVDKKTGYGIPVRGPGVAVNIADLGKLPATRILTWSEMQTAIDRGRVFWNETIPF